MRIKILHNECEELSSKKRGGSGLRREVLLATQKVKCRDNLRQMPSPEGGGRSLRGVTVPYLSELLTLWMGPLPPPGANGTALSSPDHLSPPLYSTPCHKPISIPRPLNPLFRTYFTPISHLFHTPSLSHILAVSLRKTRFKLISFRLPGNAGRFLGSPLIPIPLNPPPALLTIAITSSSCFIASPCEATVPPLKVSFGIFKEKGILPPYMVYQVTQQGDYHNFLNCLDEFTTPDTNFTRNIL